MLKIIKSFLVLLVISIFAISPSFATGSFNFLDTKTYRDYLKDDQTKIAIVINQNGREFGPFLFHLNDIKDIPYFENNRNFGSFRGQLDESKEKEPIQSEENEVPELILSDISLNTFHKFINFNFMGG